MCGIVGIVNRDLQNPCDESVLIAMRDLMAYRGPDDQGCFIKGHVGLGHRRLSIIDLSGGQQPMSNEDGTVWITYNGEIYNFEELSLDLKAKGHIFRTRSDTEMIVHAYEEYGIDCVSRFNGMFAFAIYDMKENIVFVARDRIGIKPVYYRETADSFLFASEIKSLFVPGLPAAEMESEAIFEYMLFRHVSGSGTMFKDVLSLPPGHVLVWKSGSPEIRQYWSVYPRDEMKQTSLEECSAELDHILQDAVRIRLMSDVPLGTFCSGGIDSSLVTALAAKNGGSSLNTFSVGFSEEGFDETSFARMVSGRYGTEHHEISLTSQEFSDLLPKMIWHNDEPLNFANSIHIYAISRLAKEFVTVVLTGEGADELFSGYPRYFIPRLTDLYNRLPGPLQVVLRAINGIIGDHRLGKVIASSKYGALENVLLNASVVNRDILESTLNNSLDRNFEFREECLQKGVSMGLSNEENMYLLDQQNYLLSILQRQDKMSMAASIEARVPFLDYRIIEFANRIPSRIKTKGFTTKKPVKRVAMAYLAREVVQRRKSGFGVPLRQWLMDRPGMGERLDQLREDRSVDDIFDRKLLENIIREHGNGERDHSEFLWTLMNFQIWRQVFSV